MIRALIVVLFLVLTGILPPWGSQIHAQEVPADEVLPAQPAGAESVSPAADETQAEEAPVAPVENTAADAAEAQDETEPAAPKVPRSSQLYSNSYALVIGINAYTNGWPSLINAVKDAELMAAEMEI